jgi:hypothetical protein
MGAVGVLEGRLFAPGDALGIPNHPLDLLVVQLQYQAVILSKYQATGCSQL